MPILFSFVDRRIDAIDLSIRKTETWFACESRKLCDNNQFEIEQLFVKQGPEVNYKGVLF